MRTAEARLVDDVVDTTRYPLSGPGTPAWDAVVAQARADLHHRGCCVLRDFIRPALREPLRRQGDDVAPWAYYDVEVVNAYNIPSDAALPVDHPGRIAMQRRNAFVARDHIPDHHLIHQLYVNDLFQRFVADCFELPEVHPLADPLAGLVLNVVGPGMDHPWHFDTNEFAVSLLTRSPDEGGVFEYCPGIRSPESENLDDVRGVLRGERDHLVHRLDLRPGDLQLFLGRFSLHRVSTVRGTTDRHSAIFAYSARPGVVGTEARTRQLFGRVAAEHLASRTGAVRGDELLD
jgi:hypothetical protein